MIRLQSFLLLLVFTLPVYGDEEFFDSDGIKIRYTDQGKGEPVILLHGYTASGDINWRLPGVTSLLSSDYRVIVPDARGHGKSDKPLDPNVYGANMVDDVVRLMDHLDIKSAHVVGYSMGGMMTIKLMATYPKRVRSAVIGGMGWMDSDSERIKRYRESNRLEPKTALQACIQGFADLAISKAQLEAIDQPFVILIGSDDGLKETVDALEEVRKDANIVIIPEANHRSCVFKPEFRDGIKQFLDEQESK